MKGTSGFQEVRSSTSRSPAYRLLQEQQHQFGTGAWHLFPTHDLIALSTDISTKQETVPDTVFMPRFNKGYQLRACRNASVLCGWFLSLDFQRSRP